MQYALANRFCESTRVVVEELFRATQRYVLCNKTQDLAELLNLAQHLNNCDKLQPKESAGSLH